MLVHRIQFELHRLAFGWHRFVSIVHRRLQYTYKMMCCHPMHTQTIVYCMRKNVSSTHKHTNRSLSFIFMSHVLLLCVCMCVFRISPAENICLWRPQWHWGLYFYIRNHAPSVFLSIYILYFPGCAQLFACKHKEYAIRCYFLAASMDNKQPYGKCSEFNTIPYVWYIGMTCCVASNRREMSLIDSKISKLLYCCCCCIIIQSSSFPIEWFLAIPTKDTHKSSTKILSSSVMLIIRAIYHICEVAREIDNKTIITMRRYDMIWS